MRDLAVFAMVLSTVLPGCDSSAEPTACEASLLEYAAAAGQCATPFGVGESCPVGEDESCEGGLRCIMGVCVLSSIVGEPCWSTADCATPLFCQSHTVDGVELPLRVCAAPLLAGEACYVKDDGCLSPLDCVGSICAEDSEQGGPCVYNSDCSDGLYCHDVDEAGAPTTGSCQPELALGQTCQDGVTPCGSGASCFGGICRSDGIDGDVCASNSDCDGDHYCERHDECGQEVVQRHCRPERALGEACHDSNTGMCANSNCVAGTCVADLPFGAPCEWSWDCEAGLWCAR